jgi:hypothetical protein
MTYAYNNTVVNTGNGLLIRNADSRVFNNLVQASSGDAYIIDSLATTGSNLADDATSPDDAFDSQVINFVDPVGKDFRLRADDTAAIGTGVDLSADAFRPFSVDITNQVRTAPWDIGAFIAP